MNHFEIKVKYDTESSMWVCFCDALHLVTEASSYEALVERAWLIAPDLFTDNNLPGKVEDMRLTFIHERTRAPDFSGQPAPVFA